MLHKQSNEEKTWYGFHIETGKGSMLGEHWIYNIYLHAKLQLHNSVLCLISLNNLNSPMKNDSTYL